MLTKKLFTDEQLEELCNKFKIIKKKKYDIIKKDNKQYRPIKKIFKKNKPVE